MVILSGSILAVDFGEARIGLALASYEAKFAHPVGTLQNNSSLLQQLRGLCEKEKITHLVIGLPRGMNGQDTNQTAAARVFGAKLAEGLELPISWQDEAVTSAKAKAELEDRGKPYAKEEIDSLAATYILEDYLHEQV
jgi:putative Holliday junction resolvase